MEGEGPKLEAIRESSDISKLSCSQLETRLAPVYETLAGIRHSLPSEGFSDVATIGFAGAPWTVATYMVEGGSSRDFFNVKIMAYRDPVGFAALIDLLVEATAQYLICQIEAGAEAVQLFDSWAGALDPDEFRKWVILPTKRIVELVRDSYPEVPIIGFPKGAGYSYMAYAQDTGVTALSLDSQVPQKWVARALQPVMPVQGNLDPLCLYAGGDALKLAVERIFSDLDGGPFIFNLGHGIHKDTPVEHVEELVRLIRDFGS